MLTAPARYHNPAHHRDVIERASVATYYPGEAITGKGRYALICDVRCAVMHVLAGRGLTPDGIGRLLNRDRTTVLHGLARAADLSATDADFARLCEVIK